MATINAIEARKERITEALDEPVLRRRPRKKRRRLRLKRSAPAKGVEEQEQEPSSKSEQSTRERLLKLLDETLAPIKSKEEDDIRPQGPHQRRTEILTKIVSAVALLGNGSSRRPASLLSRSNR